MMACTSPALTLKLMPLRISFCSTLACRFLISSIRNPKEFLIFNCRIRQSPIGYRQSPLPDASFQAHTQQLLSFNGELHRQLAEDLLTKAVDDHADRVFAGKSALTKIEDLVLPDF